MPTPTVTLRRESAGQYVTPDGRYRIEYEEWWLDGECGCIMCQQGSDCPHGGDALRKGWTVWKGDMDGNHLGDEPFGFETLREAKAYLAAHLAKENWP